MLNIGVPPSTKLQGPLLFPLSRIFCLSTLLCQTAHSDIYSQTKMFAAWSRRFDGDQIVPRVFLGSACTEVAALMENKITHVVTVAIEHKEPACLQAAHYLVVHVDDDPDENLLAVLDRCVDYIDVALRSSEDAKVFVHWCDFSWDR